MPQTASPAARAAAEKLFARVTAGLTVFTKAASGGWMIIGPALSIVEGSEVTVTKSDGSTKRVRVARVETDSEKRGVAYCVATFTDFRTEDHPGMAFARPGATRAAAPRRAAYGGCDECGRRASLTRCADSSGLIGDCCASCAAGPDQERSFA